MQFPYQKISITLVSGLPPRTKDVLVRRFGLQEEEPQTLEAIGQSHGITRERVRQIVEDGIRQVKEAAKENREQEKLEAIFELLSDILKDSGYLKRQDLLVEAVQAQKAGNHVVFLLHLGDQFYKHKETEYVHPFWASRKEVVEASPSVLDKILHFLQERKEALHFDELRKAHGEIETEKLNPRTLASLLEVSKLITQAYNGKWGLREWPEVYPKGMRDKAYVVLKNATKPLHFIDVTQLIEQLQESLVDQKKKSVLPQTVHNELIKDPRFILVGRGTYGLSEWGYKPGTVKDVIREILKENGEAMDKEKIIQKTLAQRQVKESTILLNLQDKRAFLRDQGGNYHLVS
ncbi:MAG TPA: sigma factor-like helix-turn-helix DNA-binding protein [Candidatus Paceibacterota bacterium]|nr:sigma factor-like helix-turn-helix DNA-binding protein [Candidatus Paceibacterota bacterium]